MKVKILVALATAAVLGLCVTAQAATCVDGGCHDYQVSYKYLHGPLAVEEAGIPGCASCHVEKAPCSKDKAGNYEYAAQKEGLCISCHEPSESPDHVGRKKGCLKCHSPHGSNKSAVMKWDKEDKARRKK